VLVDLLRKRDPGAPFVFTSSVAVFGPTPDASRPISVETDAPRPEGTYARTKLEAEDLIRQSGIEYVILRLSAAMYTVFGVDDMKRMYSIPLNNRLETCHPDDVAVAIVNAVSRFDKVKGHTLIVSGGPGHRMLYGDMIQEILDVMALPVPPAEKFTKEPQYLDWYDTSRSEELLAFQHRTFRDYVRDYRNELARKFSPLFIPFMSLFVGPLFGKAIVRVM
jgi:nucleoside-diphosphate-sugar epimerase